MKLRKITRRSVLKSAGVLASGAVLPSIAWTEESATGVRLTGQAAAPASRYTWPVRPLLNADLSRALFVRNLSKPVEKSVLLDDMETDRGWQASPAVELSYTAERAKAGTRSLRFTTEQRNEEFIRQSRSWNGSFTGNGPTFTFSPGAAWAKLRFAQPRDLSEYNRISLWCFPHVTGNPISSLCLQFLCEGAPSGPYDPVALNYIADLKEGEWNQLTWEISEYRRDRIAEIVLFQPLSGVPYRNLQSRLTYDFDQLTMERVEVEQVSGWTIRPSKMCYSHIGYGTDGEKRALSSDEGVRSFDLLEAGSGKVVEQFPAASLTTLRGRFSACDFGQFTKPGTYKLRAGDAVSETFEIAAKPWRSLVEATLNAFYGLRCGFAVPGMHAACHCDVLARYKGQTRSVGGGWHDAANMSQDTENTNASVVALLDLSESLATHDPELSARALEEARWGLEWIMRLRFEPGVRLLAGSYSYYTDGLLGTPDDVVIENRPPAPKPSGSVVQGQQKDPFASMMFRTVIGSDTFKNLGGALAEVRGARALKRTDKTLAAELLQAAEEDFATVLRDRPAPPQETGTPNWHTQPWQNEAGYIALTATELYRETGKEAYAQAAMQYARWVLDVQELRFLQGAPVTGYFYEDAGRTRILREQQRTSGAMNSFEEGASLAYRALCETFPDHQDWIRWYEGLLAFSEFFCRTGSAASAPYRVVPAAVWREEDVNAPVSEDFLAARGTTNPDPLFSSPVTPELVSKEIHEMYEAGVPLSAEQRLRVFPLPTDHIRHGGTTVHLTKTIALGAAAAVRRDNSLAELAADQVRWLVGANPFSRSLVYGVGFDWWQNFTVALPNIYGGMAVGMNTYRDDSPAWGNNAVFPYKEIWVLTSARMASVLAALCADATVMGHAPHGASFESLATGEKKAVSAGRFAVKLLPGRYVVRSGTAERVLELVSGGRYNLDLTPGNEIDLSIEAERIDSGGMRLRLRARGSGRHVVELRCANLKLPDAAVTVDLTRHGELVREIPAQVVQDDRAWIVVAVPDGKVEAACEAHGVPHGLNPLGGSASVV